MLGGSFDPPHVGHVMLAAEAWWRLGLERVLLVPAAHQPLKPGGPALPADLRVRLVEAAAAGHPGLAVSRVEIDRGGPSYTADTLDEIAAAEPGADLWFLLGADQLMDLPRWREPARILACARLAVARRDAQDAGALSAAAERIAPGRVDWVDMPEIGVSSTMVRARIAAGEPIRYLVPPAVEGLLRAQGLLSDRIGGPAPG